MAPDGMSKGRAQDCREAQEARQQRVSEASLFILHLRLLAPNTPKSRGKTALEPAPEKAHNGDSKKRRKIWNSAAPLTEVQTSLTALACSVLEENQLPQETVVQLSQSEQSRLTSVQIAPMIGAFARRLHYGVCKPICL
jgi:hypothetical protein